MGSGPCTTMDFLMRPAPTRMIEWYLCDTAAATASWASVDLDGFQERTASGDWLRPDCRRVGGERQCERWSRKTPDKFAIASMATKLLHHCIGMHECMCIFCGEHACVLTGVVSTMHVQVCTLNRCCEHQRTHLRLSSLQGVHLRSCMCSLYIQRWGTRVGRLS